METNNKIYGIAPPVRTREKEALVSNRIAHKVCHGMAAAKGQTTEETQDETNPFQKKGRDVKGMPCLQTGKKESLGAPSCSIVVQYHDLQPWKNPSNCNCCDSLLSLRRRWYWA